MLHCLVIDDEPGMRDMLAFELGELGFSVQTAASGTEGIMLARGLAFDLVLCDIMMPGKTGIDVLRELKAADRRMRIILLTGSPTDEIARQCLQEGAWGYLPKPFTMEELSGVIAATGLDPATPGPAPVNASPQRPSDTSLSKMRKVLIADDDPSVLNFLATCMQNDGYQTETAMDGQQALAQMTQDPPDLLLLDLMMPQLDGFYLLSAMRQSTALETIPVIVVTAKELTPPQKMFLREHSSAVIQKGNQTLEHIRECLQQVGKKAA